MVHADTREQQGGPVATGPSVVPQDLSRITLIAVTVAILAEVLRVAFPQFGHYSQVHGVGTAIIVVPLVCLMI